MKNLQIIAMFSAPQPAPVDNGSHLFDISATQKEGKRKRDILLAVLDMARVADIILIVFQEDIDMDDLASEIIDTVRAKGLHSVFTLAVRAVRRDGSMRTFTGHQLVSEGLSEEPTLKLIPV